MSLRCSSSYYCDSGFMQLSIHVSPVQVLSSSDLVPRLDCCNRYKLMRGLTASGSSSDYQMMDFVCFR